MSQEESIYERRLNALLFEAANRTEDFVRQKIAIIEAGNALQDSYLAALQQCCRKHDEVLKLEEYVLSRFERALPVAHTREKQAMVSRQDALEKVAEQIASPESPYLRKIA